MSSKDQYRSAIEAHPAVETHFFGSRKCFDVARTRDYLASRSAGHRLSSEIRFCAITRNFGIRKPFTLTVSSEWLLIRSDQIVRHTVTLTRGWLCRGVWGCTFLSCVTLATFRSVHTSGHVSPSGYLTPWNTSDFQSPMHDSSLTSLRLSNCIYTL